MKIRTQDQFDIWLFVKATNNRRITLTDEEIKEETGVPLTRIACWLRNLQQDGRIRIYEEDSVRIINPYT